MKSTDPAQDVQKNLQVLGIEPDASQQYTALFKLGPASALQLSKATGISRTQTYRNIEVLQAHSLVSAEKLSYGTLFRALPIDNLAATIASREAETAAVKQNLQHMAHALEILAGSSGASPKSTTYHYYGVGGLKQVNWNLTKATHEYRVFETAHLSQHFDKVFARRCREQYIARQLTSYDLTNATSVAAQEIEPFEPSRSFLRHIDPEILTINFELYTYDDVVTLLDYGKHDTTSHQPIAHATEIHHPALAAMMRQIFDAMWNLGEPLEVSTR